MDDNIYEYVYNLINDNFKLDNRKIKVNENLMDLGLDSISMVQIVLGIEEICKITIPDEDLIFDNFCTIERIVQYIEGLNNE